MLTKKTALALASILAFAGLILVACGGGSGTSVNEDNVARTTCKPDTPPVFAAPADLPADQKEFQSADRGYTARYPADWEAKANQSAVGNAVADAFFGPPIGASARVNISVACETVPIGTTSIQFTQAKMEVMREVFGSSPSQAEQFQVDGKDAYLITFAIGEETPSAIVEGTPEPLNAETVQAMFADDRGGWVISLLAPQGELAAYRPLFDAFVASFHEQ
jgi:hypothetical protein